MSQASLHRHLASQLICPAKVADGGCDFPARTKAVSGVCMCNLSRCVCSACLSLAQRWVFCLAQQHLQSVVRIFLPKESVKSQ